MNILDKIELINSQGLDKRINAWKDLCDLASFFLTSKSQDITIAYKIIECAKGIRSSRFIDSDIDITFLNISLEIAYKFNVNPKLLKELLINALYYSNYFPDKYNKIEIEKEIQKIERFH
jgi:hypothetical protein